MAASRNSGAKRQPIADAGALVPASTPPQAKLSADLRVFSPADFRTDRRTERVMTALLAACQASDAAEALIPWFCDKLRSPKSRKDYFDQQRSFFEHLAAQGIHPYHATGDHVRLYKEALEQDGKAAGTIAHALSVIRGTYEQFGRKGLVPWPVVGDIQAVTAPPVDKNTTPSLDEATAIKLLHAPDTSTMLGCRDHALLFTYFKTLCRRTAIAGAKIGSLNFNGTEWEIAVTEKRKKKIKRLLLEAAPAVLRWVEFSGRSLAQTDAPLFPALGPDRKTVTDRHLSGRAVLNMVKRYARQIGLNPQPVEGRGICTHTLRKTGANDILDNGGEITQLQMLMVHADIRTTQVYKVYTDKDAEEAARRNQIR
jgi:integrase/recombinase XerD